MALGGRGRLRFSSLVDCAKSYGLHQCFTTWILASETHHDVLLCCILSLLIITLLSLPGQYSYHPSLRVLAPHAPAPNQGHPTHIIRLQTVPRTTSTTSNPTRRAVRERCIQFTTASYAAQRVPNWIQCSHVRLFNHRAGISRPVDGIVSLNSRFGPPSTHIKPRVRSP